MSFLSFTLLYYQLGWLVGEGRGSFLWKVNMSLSHKSPDYYVVKFHVKTVITSIQTATLWPPEFQT